MYHCVQPANATSSAFGGDDDDEAPAPSSLAAKLKAMAAQDQAKKAALLQSQAAMETVETKEEEEEEDDDGVDPLDAFMQGVTAQVDTLHYTHPTHTHSSPSMVALTRRPNSVYFASSAWFSLF